MAVVEKQWKSLVNEKEEAMQLMECRHRNRLEDAENKIRYVLLAIASIIIITLYVFSVYRFDASACVSCYSFFFSVEVETEDAFLILSCLTRSPINAVTYHSSFVLYARDEHHSLRISFSH